MEGNIRNIPFRRVLSQLHLLHKIEVNEDEFIDIALTGWQKIGNKDVVYNAVTDLEIEDGTGYVYLPCDVEEIKSVSVGRFDTTEFFGYDYNANNSYADPRETIGYNIPYQYIDSRKIQLIEVTDADFNYNRVNIIYKTIKTDEEGLPYLNHRELDAIVKWCAFNYFQRMFITGNPLATPQIIDWLKAEWHRLCANARVRVTNTNNMTNSIFRFLSSANIKQYNRTHRLFRDV